ncbi:MAG: DUF692 family protein [Firmicutes bacterium]|nr:DUF692 family protein [Bacillota bacterium]
MKLACNYYAETEALVREGRIDIDYFKFPGLGFQMDALRDADAFAPFAERVRRLRPILLHGVYPDMERLIALSGTPGVSLHPYQGPKMPPLREIIENLAALREKYAHMEFVSVENFPNLKYGDCIKPEVITEMVVQSGCDFLLDVSHAYCAARDLREDFRAYLSRLPLDRVSEIHINGWAEKDGKLMCHVKINELGYRVLRELLAVCSPKIISIEYGRPDDRIGCGCPVMRPGERNAAAMEEIAEQVERIKEIIS